MKVAVVGNGHVGLVLAACLAEMGYDVTGIDRQATVELLNRGEVGFIEPGLSEMVHRHVRDGRLHATTRLEDVKGSRIVWIAVGTMQTPDGAIHIDDIKQIVVKLGQLCSTDTVIAIKSTMPVGACRRLARKLPVNGPPLVYNPEFLRQGSAIYDFFHPGKVVLGTGPQGGAEPLAEAYKSFCCPHIYTNWETAEIIKLVQNAFNALRISFLNEITLATEGLDVSLGMLSQALRENEPALRRYMNPGFSYGGSCLPNNIAYLTYFARARGYTAPLLQAVATVNDLRITHLIKTISQAIGGFEGRRVSLWGLTYKAGTDDLRDSPSVRLAETLLKAGAQVPV